MLFEIGSTTLFAMGIDAGEDAWLVDFLGMINGFLLILFFTQFQKNFPGRNFMEIIEALTGKVIGIPVAVLYGLYFIGSGAVNFGEFNFLMNITFLQKTPLKVIALVFMLLIAIYIFWGIETVARTGEILFPVMIAFILLIYILTPASGVCRFNRLAPVLGNGFGPVLKALYPYALVFPFGESFVFMMFWKYTDSLPKIRKTSMRGVLLTGLLLMASSVLILSVLGAKYAAVSSLPLLNVIKTIDLMGVFSNMAALGIVLFFIGGFYKAMLNLLAGALALSTALRVGRRWLIVPVCAAAYWIAFASFPSLPALRYSTKVVFYNIHLLFEIVLPLALYLIYLTKKYVLKIDPALQRTSQGSENSV